MNNFLNTTLLVLAGLLAVQVIWLLANPPLIRKPRTWFISLPLKLNSALVSALTAFSFA